VVWDLAVHDLSIMDHTLPHRPVAVSATGLKHVANRPESVAFITLFFEQKLIAHINVSWLSPVKIRRTLVGGDQKMIVYDDLEPSEKLKVYDRGITVVDDPDSVHEVMVNYRTGDMWAPRLSPVEALLTEAKHFVECVELKKEPRTDGPAGVRVVRLLEAASRSLELQGVPQAVPGLDPGT
jgi:predicted dehydrogenase